MQCGNALFSAALGLQLNSFKLIYALTDGGGEGRNDKIIKKAENNLHAANENEIYHSELSAIFVGFLFCLNNLK